MIITIDKHNNNEVANAISKIRKVTDFFEIDFEQLKGIEFIRVNCNVNKLIEGIIISPWANKNYYYEIEKF